jgi:hypothetical protein
MPMIQGEIEIDSHRGVIYFHNYFNGITTLRICGLKEHLKKFKTGTQLDITVNAEDSKSYVMRSDIPDEPEPQIRFEAKPQFGKISNFAVEPLAANAKNFFLNEQHTTHISKAQARKERAEYKKKCAEEDAKVEAAIARQAVHADRPTKKRKKK